mmetsp:Transcript_1668/g.4217  ORF Transcript_1668/g.4217 Transcript_1668/m.4217 type:complete len:118 (+) Transcript_1668:1013-1366(+)
MRYKIIPSVKLSKILLKYLCMAAISANRSVPLHLHSTPNSSQNNIQITTTLLIQMNLFFLSNQHHLTLFPERSLHPKRGFPCIFPCALKNEWLSSSRIFERFRLDNFSYFGVDASRN